MTTGAPRELQLSQEVQEIIMICFLGVITYLVMVCCIICRRPAELHENLEWEAKAEGFSRREPKDGDGYYFNQSSEEVVRKSVEGEVGRLMVDRGTLRFITGTGVVCSLDRSRYATFSADENFSLADRSEDVLFHLEVYRELFRIERSPDQVDAHQERRKLE